ncbi:MAG: GntR family transcriptional regulator [Bacillota bacterium]|nr:MAG: GntR family transcriptional regulator [Bacillota bacterium]
MLDKQSPTPLYNQLVDHLIRMIQTSMKPGDRMPSEREVCEKYGVSRTTVRAAFSELEDLGYIYRRHGKGTFVSALWKEMQNLSEIYSFTEHMKRLGMKPETRILSFEQGVANQSTAERLQISEGSAIYRLRRLRLADGLPMMLELTFIPAYLFPGLTRELLESMPLYDLYSRRFNQEIKYADEEFYASLIQDKEAELLGVPAGSACLRLVRTTYNMDNRVIEFTISAARADQFVYKIRHWRK